MPPHVVLNEILSVTTLDIELFLLSSYFFPKLWFYFLIFKKEFIHIKLLKKYSRYIENSGRWKRIKVIHCFII